jgi:hypothetical protein
LLVGFFDDEGRVLEATAAARKAGLKIEDVYTPYAVHGMDEAMGLAPSRLTWVCFLAGLGGLTFALGFQVWTQAVAWPLNIGGKPFNSFPAFIPVGFELTVLSAALTSVAALFARAGLFPGRPTQVLEGVTNDRFALALVATGSNDEERGRKLCQEHGAVEISLRLAGAAAAPVALPEKAAASHDSAPVAHAALSAEVKL